MMNNDPIASYQNFQEINLTDNNFSTLKLIYLNIRSCRQNFTNLCAELHAIINSIDIIVLAETNITDEETSLFTIDGFDSAFVNRQNKRGGGIAVFIKNNLKYEIQNLKTDCFENMLTKVEIKGNHQQTLEQPFAKN